MRKLDTSSVTGAIGLPIKAGTLNHIQLAYQEALTSAINAIIGGNYNPSGMYLLYGCLNTGSGLNYTISAGAVYLGGEIYQVPATSFTAASGQVATCVLTPTFFTDPTADPVLFTDSLSRNVHQIRSVTIVPGASGSGSCDFTALLKGNSAQVPINSLVSYVPAGGSLGEFDGTGKGITYNTFGWALCNGQNGTTDLRGKFLVGYNATDANYASVGSTGGSKATTLVLANIPAHTHQIHTDASGGAYGGSGHLVSGNSAGSTVGPTTDGSEGGLQASPNPFDTRPPFYTVLYIQRIY